MTMDFTPGPVARIASTVPGALLLFVAGWNLADRPVTAAALAVAGALLAWRGWRLGVAVEGDSLVIRNYDCAELLWRAICAAQLRRPVA
jgi:hypothetical protein